MSRRIEKCPTCKGKGEIIVDDWLTEGMTEEEIAKKKVEALADIVEVVRCKDCKFFEYGDYCSEGKMEHSRCRETDYCSYGERKANDGT